MRLTQQNNRIWKRHLLDINPTCPVEERRVIAARAVGRNIGRVRVSKTTNTELKHDETITYIKANGQIWTGGCQRQVGQGDGPWETTADEGPMLDTQLSLFARYSIALIHFLRRQSRLLGSFSAGYTRLNSFTPKSDQFQISPVASPEIYHHTVWRTWLFIVCSHQISPEIYHHTVWRTWLFIAY